ncbi:MAG: hypothetical protein Q7J76_03260 [Candidatus Brocadiaceae bacterium]|uniref:hypothetical protein n=1 Tax=Candidatus Wunengus sp. YC61 TaxID=3367698 RepID=UPI00271D10FF|nr:hypothetical protein [Candidatus Brocadiaceae bacterium]
MKCIVANITIELSGSGEVYNNISKELSGFPETKEDSEVCFTINTKKLEVPPDVTVASDIFYNARYFALKSTPLKFEIKGRIFEKEPLEVNVYPAIPRKRSFRTRERFRDWNFFTIEETLAKNFVYNIFDFVMELKLLVNSSSFIHASSLEKDGKAILFVAAGGIGKTSIMMQMLKKEGWKYLADDLSIIDSNGRVYFNPKYIQIYPYNIKNDFELYNLLIKGRGALDRLHWSYRKLRYGEASVRRRVDPRVFFGPGKVSSSAQVAKVINLVRTNVNDFEIDGIGHDVISNMAAEILSLEISPFFKYSCLCNGGGSDSPFPKIEEIKERAIRRFQEIFNNVPRYQLKIPLKASPSDLFEYIDKNTSIIHV